MGWESTTTPVASVARHKAIAAADGMGWDGIVWDGEASMSGARPLTSTSTSTARSAFLTLLVMVNNIPEAIGPTVARLSWVSLVSVSNFLLDSFGTTWTGLSVLTY